MSEIALELGQEYPPAGEAAQIEQIFAISQSSMEHKPHPPTPRDQHPKSHGYVQGEFTISADLPDELKVGVFATPKTYPIWIRFSNGGSKRDATGKFVPDTTGDIRGMAIKLMGVDGEFATADLEHSGEQDFILMNSPTFFARDSQGYMYLFPVAKAIEDGKITFNPDGSPKDIPTELQVPFKAIAYAFGLLKQITAKQTSSPLEIDYWSATPYKFGDRAMKFAVVPHLNGEKFKLENAIDKSNYLREAMTQHLASQAADFDFTIQLQTDAVKMPIEDPTVEWSERESPYIKVATIRIPPQDFNTEERKQQDEQQSFSPWRSLAVHRPLGGINRVRQIYIGLAKIRKQRDRQNAGECG
jgi:catalase